MPRLANGGKAVAIWYEQAGGNGSSTYDLCTECAEDPETALESLEPYNGDPKGDESA